MVHITEVVVYAIVSPLSIVCDLVIMIIMMVPITTTTMKTVMVFFLMYLFTVSAKKYIEPHVRPVILGKELVTTTYIHTRIALLW